MPAPVESTLPRRQLLLAAACGAAAFAVPTVAHAAPEAAPQPPRESEVAPPIEGNWKPEDRAWASDILLGQSAYQAIIAPPDYKLSGEVTKVVESLGPKGVQVIRVSKAAAADAFATVVSRTVNPTPARFLAVDRAGWLRVCEPLPSDPVKLAYLMSSTGDPTPTLKEGTLAPDFAFQDADGFWRRPSALRGRRNLLLTFFPKCFTGHCQTHLSSLRDNWPGFLVSQTDIWAISVDPAEGEHGQREFIKFLGLPFPMLPDTGRNVCLLYEGARSPNQMAIRQSVLIDKAGIVRWIDRAVQPATHGVDVLAKLKTLGLA